MLLADRPQPRGTITQQTVNTVSCPSHPWKRTFVARSGSGASNERDFQTSRNVRLRGTPIGPDAARRQPTRTWHCYLACALHTDPPGPLRACTCKTNPALAPNARAPAVQTRATRLTTGHKSIPARPGYAPSRLARPLHPPHCVHPRSSTSPFPLCSRGLTGSLTPTATPVCVCVCECVREREVRV